MSALSRDAEEAVEDVVRTSYGRLVAYLASITHDIASAEDCLSDALLAALATWPQRGVPDLPATWLLTAARRSFIGRARRASTAARAEPTLAVIASELAEDRDEIVVPDKRLELLYACAHPAIDSSLRAPLMLQTIFGLDAVRIGEAFLVAPTTLGQRLVRAKKKIKDAGVPFRLPEPDDLPVRTGAVLDAIYAAYGAGWDDPSGLDAARHGLTREALRLVEVLTDVRPDDAEAHGLAAMLWHIESRAAARRTSAGDFVPLQEQPVELWSRDAIRRAESHLSHAFALRSVGAYQLLAAIQSVHNRRAFTGTTDWVAIAKLYDGVVGYWPTVGALVARASAYLEAFGPDASETALSEVPLPRADSYQPYWVLRSEIARRRGDAAAAEPALQQAIELTTDPAVRAWLSRERNPLPE